MIDKAKKPGRPFGVTLAIIVSLLVFTVIPLAQIGLIVSIERFVQSQNDTPLLSEQEGNVTGFQSGGEFVSDTNDDQLTLQVVLSVGFLFIAAFAWRGQPAFMRYVFMATVLIQTAVNVWLIVAPRWQQSAQTTGGSLDGFLASLQCGQLALIVLVPVYVVWYLNRGPARAFYRGYYLNEENRPA